MDEQRITRHQLTFPQKMAMVRWLENESEAVVLVKTRAVLAAEMTKVLGFPVEQNNVRFGLKTLGWKCARASKEKRKHALRIIVKEIMHMQKQLGIDPNPALLELI